MATCTSGSEVRTGETGLSRDRHRAPVRPYLATKALDDVRRDSWNDMRQQDVELAKRFKGARWSLMKNPENLNNKQAVQLDRIRRAGGAAWRAYTHKEAVREIFHGDLDEEEASELIDRAISRCQRSRLKSFVKLSRTLREHKEGILASIRLGISNARAEALNTKVRNIIRRAYGFHSAEAATALVMLACGPIELHLPHEKAAV